MDAVRVVPFVVVSLVGACASMASLESNAAPPPSASGTAFFESRIRPVLIEHCYECHNSAETSEGGFAVDHRQGLRDGGDGGKWIQPGNSDQSRLIAVLRHEIDDLEMPQDGPKLDDRVVEDFEKWISTGAPDPRDEPPSIEALTEATSWDATLRRRKQWWSFQPIQATRPPASGDASDHPIDRFVHAKIDASGLSPSAPAKSTVLIRRLFINLIGLPPRDDEFDAWMSRFQAAGQVGRAQVIRQLVDHLIDSPHFGERWARHWMDWIRYAESHGSEGDPRIDNAWMYRDYLIRAINADVPYDQLVREHVAGDLLDDPRINSEMGINESAIGPAHWRMVFHGFAPTDPLDEKVRFVDDQINAFSKAFLGLTVSCARCHDHKFDAISQKDYYALFGILASCRPARTVIDLPDWQEKNRSQLAELKPKIRDAIAADWLEATSSLRAKLLSPGPPIEVEKPNQPPAVMHRLHQLQQKIAQGIEFDRAWSDLVGEHLARRPPSIDDGVLRRWDFSKAEDYARWSAQGIGLPTQPFAAGEFAIQANGDVAITGVYPAGVYSHLLSAKHPARLTSPDLDIDEAAELWVRVIGDGGASLRYVVQDYPRNGTVFPVTALKPSWTWKRDDLSYWQGDRIHVELAVGKDAPLLVKPNERSWFGVTEVRLVRKGSPPPTSRAEYPDLLFDAAVASPPKTLDDVAGIYERVLAEAIASWRSGAATRIQAELLDACLRQGILPGDVGSLPSAGSMLDEYRKLEAEIPVPTRVPGLDETSGRTQPLFVRGDHKNPAENVPRRFLEAIDPAPYPTSSGSGRLRLAEDLLRSDNPLARRVIVNRIWHHLFGRGIVATPDNFGRLGQKPTHPEMLDWLAVRFVRDGWSLKKMIRLIVTSETWQLSSNPSQLAQQRDPDNLFLSHANVRRMDAETIRDTLLSVSGRLDTRQFGAPVSGNSGRRSVYVQVIRNSLDPFLRVFDFPEPVSAVGRRDATNVPAQSLTLMNDPRVAEYATEFASRVLDDDRLQTDEQRVRQLFVTGLGRTPTAADVSRVHRFLDKTKKSHDALRSRAASAESDIARHRLVVAGIMDPARDRLTKVDAEKSSSANLPTPIGQWEFEGDARDLIGKSHGTTLAGARIESGNLIVGGRAHLVTSPLGHSLHEKTLSAWVKLDHLDQRGGGLMTVQTPDGVVFDSIVFGERKPRQWMSGSNGFARTQGFQSPQEQEATNRFVHLAIAYHADGRVVGYRDGKPYGQGYQSNGPYDFKAGNVIVSFGVRHLPAGGNRMLAASIASAQLYDRALSADEIEATFHGQEFFLSPSRLLASLSQEDRQLVESSRLEIEKLRTRIESMGPIPSDQGGIGIWTDLARALFTFKEFIYVR